MISLVRFSILPGHLTTCIQSTIGISVWIFGIACAISLPKQLAVVYLGVLFGQSHKLAEEGKARSGFDDEAASNATHKVVSWTVLCVTGFLTVVAMYIIWFRMWQEEKKAAALALTSTPSSLVSESKEELTELENGLQYTLPYLHTATSDAQNRRGSSSHASTSGTLPAIHTAGRPQKGRSRSSTLTSFALSNNSLPYLPYTPMLDVQASNFPTQNHREPSPMPSAALPFPSDLSSEDGRDLLDDDRSTVSSGVDQPYVHIHGSTSQDPTAASSEISVRARRIRLHRSTSNLLIRPASGETISPDKQLTGDLSAPMVYPSEETFPPSPTVRAMERAASPGPSGRQQQRTRSRAPSNLGPSRDVPPDSSSYISKQHMLSGNFGDSQ